MEYLPPISNESKLTTTTVSGRTGAGATPIGACLGLTPGFASAHYDTTFTRETSCLTVLNGRSGTRTFQWNNGTTSVFAYESSTQRVNGNVIATLFGTIHDGAFEGSRAVMTVTGPEPDLLACLGDGVPSVDSVTQFVIG